MLSKGAKSESSDLMIQTEPPIHTAASSSAAPTPPWIELPEELTANILKRLDAEEIIMSAMVVCSRWWRVCKNPSMWRVIHLGSVGCEGGNNETILRCAVEFSHGQLLELKLSGFIVDNGLLNYIAHRSNQLRCLTLDTFFLKDYSVLTAAIKKLTQLEELHLTMIPSLTPQDFETIGDSLPMLKSFSYTNICGGPSEITEHAVAIGKSMPNLRHLGLFLHSIGNHGLEAILDGCPNLESLHLRHSCSLDLREGLGKRCSNQIKDLSIVAFGSLFDTGPFPLHLDDLFAEIDDDDGDGCGGFDDSFEDLQHGSIFNLDDDDGCGGFADSNGFEPY